MGLDALRGAPAQRLVHGLTWCYSSQGVEEIRPGAPAHHSKARSGPTVRGHSEPSAIAAGHPPGRRVRIQGLLDPGGSGRCGRGPGEGRRAGAADELLLAVWVDLYSELGRSLRTCPRFVDKWPLGTDAGSRVMLTSRLPSGRLDDRSGNSASTEITHRGLAHCEVRRWRDQVG